MSASILLVALLLDHMIGWPDRLYQRLGHPVTWLGKLIEWFERTLNQWSTATRFNGRLMGLITLLLIVTLSAMLGWGLQKALANYGWLVWFIAVAAWPLLAMRSLKEHVEAVAKPLSEQDLPNARLAVSMIVGRNPKNLDESGISRAAIESLAENTSDGVVAPLFWALLLGLPGLFIYKSVNTLDSMIGHHSDRYEHFGWASANADDWLNIVPARLTGLLFAAQSLKSKKSVLSILKAVRVAGPRYYEQLKVDEPYFNPAAPDASVQDIYRALTSYRWLMILVVALLLLVALLQSVL